ncbi:MAG: NADH-quinone oxidoreductase subunit NuoE [Nanobdellota archaeon]
MSKKEVLDRHEGREDELINVLQEIQEKEGYLSPKTLAYVSKHMDIPYAKVYGVATFYNFFKLKPGGKYTIQMCKGTACHVKGSSELFDHLKKKLDVEENGTTEDGIFTLSPVNCLGMCSLAPCMMINGKVYSELDKERLDSIIDDMRK